MLILKKIRTTYHILRQKLACADAETFTKTTTRKNPFGSGDATVIAEYCSVTGKYKGEKIYVENAEEIIKDLEGLCA